MPPRENQNQLAQFFEKIGRSAIAGVEEIGNGGVMVTESLYWLFFGYRVKQPVRLNAVIQQMMDIGISAIPIIALLGGSISVTLAIQGIYTLRIFGAESHVTAGLAFIVVREFAPMITGILVAGRSGSALAARIGTKNGIYLALVVYCGISIAGYYMSEPWHFWALASALGLVQGGSQALSRSLFASMVPPSKSSQFFGFYSVSGKFGNIIGPLVFAVVAQWTGGGRHAILALIAFFIVGMFLLSFVDVDDGRQAAIKAEANV